MPSSSSEFPHGQPAAPSVSRFFFSCFIGFPWWPALSAAAVPAPVTLTDYFDYHCLRLFNLEWKFGSNTHFCLPANLQKYLIEIMSKNQFALTIHSSGFLTLLPTSLDCLYVLLAGLHLYPFFINSCIQYHINLI